MNSKSYLLGFVVMYHSNFEFPLITKAGARIEVLLNATTRRNEHGKVIGVVGIGQDITGELMILYIEKELKVIDYLITANTLRT